MHLSTPDKYNYLRIIVLNIKYNMTEVVTKTIEKIPSSNSSVLGTTFRVITTKFSKMSRTSRMVACGYLGFGIINYASLSYQDGKQGLLSHRLRMKTNPPKDAPSEWEAIRDGCNSKRWENFVSSVVFPWTMISSVMPVLVRRLNPPDEEDQKK